MTNNSNLWRPYSESYKVNPYNNYEQMRLENPLYKITENTWMVLSYELVKKFSSDTNLSMNKLGKDIRKSFPVLSRMASNWLFLIDGQKHFKFKKLLSKHWDINQLKNHTEDTCQQLVDEISSNGIDIVSNYAELLPTYTMLKFFNQDLRLANEVISYSKDLLKIIEPFHRQSELRKMEDACIKFKNLIINHLHNSQNTYFNYLYESLDADKSKEEVFASLIIMIYVTSIHTSTSQLALSINAILSNEGQKTYLIGNLEKKHREIIQELVRFDSPIQLSVRIVSDQIRVGNLEIKKNQKLILNFGAANHDSNNFENANFLNLSNNFQENLAFGIGTHRCFGERLARYNLFASLRLLFKTYPNIDFNKEKSIVYSNSMALRYINTLPVILG